MPVTMSSISKAGRIGFRTLEIKTNPGFSVHINGLPIYCRGACWTVGDMASLETSSETLNQDLRLARDAGANMLRVGGTMIYESNTFYQMLR